MGWKSSWDKDREIACLFALAVTGLTEGKWSSIQIDLGSEKQRQMKTPSPHLFPPLHCLLCSRVCGHSLTALLCCCFSLILCPCSGMAFPWVFHGVSTCSGVMSSMGCMDLVLLWTVHGLQGNTYSIMVSTGCRGLCSAPGAPPPPFLTVVLTDSFLCFFLYFLPSTT